MKKVLIIDDNADYSISIIEILELESYLTLEADNGQIGLRMIRQHSPNPSACDVDMPVMNGIEVLKEVKADPVFARIPFLIITGHRDEQTLKTSRALSVEAYLIKPIAIPELLSTIAYFLIDFTNMRPQRGCKRHCRRGTHPVIMTKYADEHKDHSKGLQTNPPVERCGD